jgi:hypothetical protein
LPKTFHSFRHFERFWAALRCYSQRSVVCRMQQAKKYSHRAERRVHEPRNRAGAWERVPGNAKKNSHRGPNDGLRTLATFGTLVPEQLMYNMLYKPAFPVGGGSHHTRLRPVASFPPPLHPALAAPPSTSPFPGFFSPPKSPNPHPNPHPHPNRIRLTGAPTRRRCPSRVPSRASRSTPPRRHPRPGRRPEPARSRPRGRRRRRRPAPSPRSAT